MHTRLLSTVAATLLSAISLLACETARAQTTASEEPLARVAGPTSGAASLLSGRTLGSGATMLAAGAGWPGAWGEIAFAPASELNIHVRATALYGSPVMGLVVGAGGELAVPVRVHVLGEGGLDLAVRITPRISIGEGTIFGERQSLGLGGALSGAVLGDVHGVLGYQLDPNVTLIAGLGVGAGASIVDRSSVGAAWIVRLGAELGIEALMSRDVMLFAHVEGGYGFSNDRAGLPFYPAREVLMVSLGVGYLL